MNESISKQWINSQNKYTFLENLKLNNRLNILFACACVRQIWNKLTDQRSKNAIIITELFIDGKATKEELITAKNAAYAAYNAAYSAANATYWDTACVRQIWNKLTDQRSKNAIIITELFIDGKATKEELITAKNAAYAAYNAAYSAANATYWDTAAANVANVANAAYAAAYAATANVAYSAAYWAVYYATDTANADNERKEMIIIQGKLLESIVQPNLQYNPNWCSSTVKLLTQQIYEQQDWNLLPILADALQDNNCNNDELLFELRNGNLWCKGNKLFDEILEKRLTNYNKKNK